MLGTPPDRGYSPDQWGDPDLAAARLSADFDDVTVESGVHTWQFASHAAVMHFLTAESPMHVDVLATVPQPERDALIAAFDEAWQPHVGDHGEISFDTPYAVVAATRR